MADPVRNNWRAKVTRALTGFFRVSKDRKGACKRCGSCCYLPVKCMFLKTKNGTPSCSIYYIRFPACRKYPRTKSELVTQDTCGYNFE